MVAKGTNKATGEPDLQLPSTLETCASLPIPTAVPRARRYRITHPLQLQSYSPSRLFDQHAGFIAGCDDSTMEQFLIVSISCIRELTGERNANVAEFYG